MNIITVTQAVSLVLLISAAPAVAQTPERNGNIWGGLAHQPTKADTDRQESQARVLPSGAQRAQQADQLNALCRKLLHAADRRGC
jgi:hypothetical protein